MKATAKGIIAFYADRTRANLPGYFAEFRDDWIWVLVAGICDMVSTWAFMITGSVEEEFHPAIRMVSQILGPVLGPLVGKLAQFWAILFVTIVFRSYARIVFLAATILYFAAAGFNTWVLHQ